MDITIRVINSEKKKYINVKISSTNSCKELFKICNEMLGKVNGSCLPNIVPIHELPNLFNNFFIDKIQMITDQLDLTNAPPSYQEYKGSIVNSFIPVSETFVKRIIFELPKSCCDLDLCPPKCSLNVLIQLFLMSRKFPMTH